MLQIDHEISSLLPIDGEVQWHGVEDYRSDARNGLDTKESLRQQYRNRWGVLMAELGIKTIVDIPEVVRVPYRHDLMSVRVDRSGRRLA